MDEAPTIRFYATTKPYGCLSNFSRHRLELDGRSWPTSEHYFQAQKFLDAADVDAVCLAATPFEAARIGRQRARSFRPDWDQERDAVMRRALQAKFIQHADLRAVLCSTRGATLVEHTTNDSYWGDGGDGSGKNMLGALLQQVRAELVTTELVLREPPWLAFPGVERSDPFWRMGRGEDYLSYVSIMLSQMSELAQAEYLAYFEMPEEWRGGV